MENKTCRWEVHIDDGGLQKVYYYLDGETYPIPVPLNIDSLEITRYYLSFTYSGLFLAVV